MLSCPLSACARWLLALALLAPLGTASQIVVDPGGGGDFTDLQAAIDSAQDGDVIVVRGGQYPQITIHDRSLSILASLGTTPIVHGIRIQNLAAGRAVLSRGLESVATGGGNNALYVLQCEGTVRVEDCTLTSDAPAFEAFASTDTMLVGCTLRTLGPASTAYGAGARLRGSRAALYHCDVEGAVGPGGFYQGNPGAPGASLENESFLYLGDTLVRGGQGGDGFDFGALGGDGGPGLWVDASSVAHALASEIAGGFPGYGGFGNEGSYGPDWAGPGVLTRVAGFVPRLEIAGCAEPGTSFPLTVFGPADASVRLHVSTRGSFGFDLAHADGAFAVGPPALRPARVLGTGEARLGPLRLDSPELGVLGDLIFERRIDVAPLPAGLTPTLWLQLEVSGAQGTVLSAPRALVIRPCDDPGPDCDGDGRNDVWQTLLGLAPDENRDLVPDSCQIPRLYVDADAPPGGDGLSWATAFDSLEPAIDLANTAGVLEIWVAEGTYVVTSNPTSDYWLTLSGGCELYGGFAGGETDLSQRDPLAHPTILDGDVQQDDGAGGGLSDNELLLQVIDFGETGSAARIDGFTFRRASVPSPTWFYGGALRIRGTATQRVVIANCRFIDNPAGAIHCWSRGEVLIVSCLFAGNHRERGAGVLAEGMLHLAVANSMFTGNTTAQAGNGILLDSEWGNLSISSCTFFHGRSDSDDAAIHVTAADGFMRAHRPLRLIDSILWNNSNVGGSTEAAQFRAPADPEAFDLTVGYSDIEGLSTLQGPGLFSLDPRFVNAAGPDGIRGTSDDNLRLRAVSPCVDAGRNGGLLADRADLDLDGDTSELLPFDLDGNPRRVDDPNVPDTGSGVPPLTDLGAFERQAGP